MIVYSHANGIHGAHLDTALDPPIARALESVDGWYVGLRRGGGHHLMFVASEADAERLLEIVARELAS